MPWPETVNDKELAAIVDNEGFLYAVSDYMSGETPRIDNDEVREKWIAAHAALRELRDVLEPVMVEEGYPEQDYWT